MAEARRCDPLRQQLEVIDADLARLRDDLSEPDLPPDLKRRLRELLTKLQALRPEVQRVLTQCEGSEGGNPPA
jgi:hypothetical protein